MPYCLLRNWTKNDGIIITIRWHHLFSESVENCAFKYLHLISAVSHSEKVFHQIYEKSVRASEACFRSCPVSSFAHKHYRNFVCKTIRQPWHLWLSLGFFRVSMCNNPRLFSLKNPQKKILKSLYLCKLNFTHIYLFTSDRRQYCSVGDEKKWQYI